MSRPYTKTDSPREWARKKILDLEEAVVALKTRLDEQGEIVKALLDQRPSRFSEEALRGSEGTWRMRDGGPLKAGAVLVRVKEPREPG